MPGCGEWDLRAICANAVPPLHPVLTSRPNSGGVRFGEDWVIRTNGRRSRTDRDRVCRLRLYRRRERGGVGVEANRVTRNRVAGGSILLLPRSTLSGRREMRSVSFLEPFLQFRPSSLSSRPLGGKLEIQTPASWHIPFPPMPRTATAERRLGERAMASTPESNPTVERTHKTKREQHPQIYPQMTR